MFCVSVGCYHLPVISVFTASRSSPRNSSCTINSGCLEELQAEKGTETLSGTLGLCSIQCFYIKKKNKFNGKYGFVGLILAFKLMSAISVIKICGLLGSVIY